MTLPTRSRRFVMWIAHLALLVYLVQIVAIDHWHADPADAVGVANSNAHVLHCHGTSASCADGAALAPTVLTAVLMPLPPEPRLALIAPSVSPQSDVYIATPDQPPRDA